MRDKECCIGFGIECGEKNLLIYMCMSIPLSQTLGAANQDFVMLSAGWLHLAMLVTYDQ